jgi:hypothetical protein
MSKGLYVMLICALISGFYGAGCGGSSDPLTKAEFTEEANSICREAEAERNEALRQAADSNQGLAALANEALAPAEEMIEELEDLSPPTGEAKEVEKMIQAYKAGVAEVRGDPANPETAISAFAEANQLAESYGLTDCVI